MRRHLPTAHYVVIAVLVASACTTAAAKALAEPPPDVRALADREAARGRWLLHDGDPAAACKSFEDSERHDPRIGTLVQLADCHRRQGRIATASSELHDALDLARAQKSTWSRAYFSRKIEPALAELEPKLPRLLVTLDPPRANAPEVTLDDAPFPEDRLGTPVPVDPGEHRVTARGRGGAVWTGTIVAREAQLSPVSIPMPDEPAAAAATGASPAYQARVADRADKSAPPAASAEGSGVTVQSSTGLIVRSPASEKTLVEVLGLSYAASEALSLSLRVGAVYHASAGEPSAWGPGNPVLAATLTAPLGKYFQLNAGLATTLPTNAIGGGKMDEQRFYAELSAIDWFGTMFLPNYFDFAPGLGLSFTPPRLTLHLQTDVHEVVRARHDQLDAFDAAATALVADLSASYVVVPPLSVFAHLIEVRLLTTPSSVEADPTARADHFVSGGASIDLKVAPTKTLTPAITYARALDAPLTTQSYQLVELDLSLAM